MSRGKALCIGVGLLGIALATGIATHPAFVAQHPADRFGWFLLVFFFGIGLPVSAAMAFLLGEDSRP